MSQNTIEQPGELRPGRDARAARPRTSRKLLRRVALGVVVVGALVVAAREGLDYWHVGRFMVGTDDAYVQADSVIISPKVSGYITEILVSDNQMVHAGQVLARIDDRDYRTALDAARANVSASQADIANVTQEIAEQALVVDQAHAIVAADQAATTFAQQDLQRFTALARTGAGPIQQAQQSVAAIKETQATLQKDETGIGIAQTHVDVLKAQLARANATVLQQQAAERQAELNLGYTTITAPTDGSVGERTLRVGQYVQAGTQLMAVVPLQAVYVTANYKETQLTDVRAGQPVDIDIDTFPGTTVHGHVDSIAPASGQEFALLPPDNATGNFTKIVQRIPVKIAVDRTDPLAGMLRPGMSVEPTIDTRAEAGRG